MRLKYLLYIVLLFIIGCKNSKEKIIIVFDNEQISINEIDQSIKQELFDHLCEIHTLREKAISELLRKKALLRNEADYMLPMDSILKKYNVAINFPDPVSPYFNISDNDIYYKGNLNSSNSLIVLKNFDCDACRVLSVDIKGLYDKYHDRIKFGYVYYSADPNLTSKALEYAKSKKSYERLFDEFVSYHLIMDSTYIYGKIAELGLDIAEFEEYLNNENIEETIFNNYIRISETGINKIPSVLINKRLIKTPADIEDIEKRIVLLQ